MQTRSAMAWVTLIGVASAGLLWASPRLLTSAFPTSASRTTSFSGDGGEPYLRTRPALDASSSGRMDTALPSMPEAIADPLPYSMSAPEFLSDPAAAAAEAIAVGDVSGDGWDDLVFLSSRPAPNPWDGRVEIYVAYQRGDGHLDAAAKIAESDDIFAYQVLAADLDRDGEAEIITTTLDGVMVLHPKGDSTFAMSSAIVGNAQDMVVTDVDRDGYLDILVDSSNTSATVVHGDGRGGIRGISALPLPSSAVRTTGDVTGDGLDDLILATIFNSPLQEFRIYPALASGGYAAPVVYYRPLDANQTASIAVGDFNADGRGDLVLDEARDDASLQLYLQDSQGNLGPSRAIARRRGTGVLIAADLNRDGRTDFAMAHSGWDYIGYYLQTAVGFTSENAINAYQAHGRANYFAAGDLNHDGCGDLVVSRWSQSPVLLYGQGCVRRHTASCRLPPLPTSASASSLTPLQNGIRDVGVRQDLARGAVRPLVLNRLSASASAVPSPKSESPNRRGMPSLNR